MKLSRAEEELMNYIWERKKAFMKDLLDAYPDPKPALTTIATLLKRMQEKHIITYKTHGKAREYYPLISKESYFGSHIKGLIKNFFNNSPAQFASFFTEETQLSERELESIREVIDAQLNHRK